MANIKILDPRATKLLSHLFLIRILSKQRGLYRLKPKIINRLKPQVAKWQHLYSLKDLSHINDPRSKVYFSLAKLHLITLRHVVAHTPHSMNQVSLETLTDEGTCFCARYLCPSLFQKSYKLHPFIPFMNPNHFWKHILKHSFPIATISKKAFKSHILNIFQHYNDHPYDDDDLEMMSTIELDAQVDRFNRNIKIYSNALCVPIPASAYKNKKS